MSDHLKGVHKTGHSAPAAKAAPKAETHAAQSRLEGAHKAEKNQAPASHGHENVEIDHKGKDSAGSVPNFGAWGDKSNDHNQIKVEDKSNDRNQIRVRDKSNDRNQITGGTPGWGDDPDFKSGTHLNQKPGNSDPRVPVHPSPEPKDPKPSGEPPVNTSPFPIIPSLIPTKPGPKPNPGPHLPGEPKLPPVQLPDLKKKLNDLMEQMEKLAEQRTQENKPNPNRF